MALRAWRGGLAVGLWVALMAGSVRAEDVSISEGAREQFRAGVQLLDDPEGARYEEAYRAFQAAYAQSPSPKILGNIGLCAMKLERDGEAIDAYERYLAEVPDVERVEREQITRDLATLKASVVSVRLEISPEGATVVDQRTPVQGAAVVNRYGPGSGAVELGLRPGHHQLTVELEGYVSERWELDALPGGELSKSFALRPQQDGAAVTAGTRTEPDRPVPASVWVSLALTGAFAAGGAITGILALGDKADFDEVNDGTQPAEAESIRSRGTTLNILTDVFLGTAVVAAGLTTVLYFTRPEATEEENAAAWLVAPAVAPGMVGVGSAVTF